MVALQCFAPQLIVLRVITGRAWTRDPSTMFGTRLEFSDRSTTRVAGGSDTQDDEKYTLGSPVSVSSPSAERVIGSVA